MINYLDKSHQIIIYGLGISGIATAKFIACNFTNKIIICDDNISSINNALQNLTAYKDKFIIKDPKDLKCNSKTIIICAPGININNPSHPILYNATNQGAKIICDIELFYSLNKHQNFIAITGTNGKSTCTALTYEILRNIGINCEIGGNIGIPIFNLKQHQSQKISYILELSSYQVDLLNYSKFNIATITNISEDHIERYNNIENYTKSKLKIFNNQNIQDFAIINIDDKISHNNLSNISNQKNIINISCKKLLKNGISLLDNQISINYDNYCHKIDINPNHLIGPHNKANILSSFAISFIYLIKFHSAIKINNYYSAIVSIINNFKGLKHRLEYIGQIDNIKFYNDSKATNAQSCKFALQSFNNIFWIVGGKDKSDGILPLKPFFNRVKKAYLIGNSSNRFASILEKNNVEYELCNILETATKKALYDAKNSSLSQKTILLSPACASFDQWQNFEQRGNAFCNIFNEILQS